MAYNAFEDGGFLYAVTQIFAKLKGLLDSKYVKPSGGIPKTDLASDVQTSLGNADTALQTAPVTSVNGQTGAVVIQTATPPKVASVTLSATWSGDDPYTQTVTISGETITTNSKIDLQPDATALAQMIDDGTSALWIENNNGALTAYAIGAGTSVALTIQCTIAEVTT